MLRASMLVLCLALPSVAMAGRPMAPFDSTDYAPFLATGTATVNGQAFLPTAEGERKFAISQPIYLDPWTPHAKDAIADQIAVQNALFRGMGTFVGRSSDRYGDFEELAGGYKKHYKKMDARAIAAQRTVTADADGKFSFDHVAPGRYAVSCEIMWQDPTRKPTSPLAILSSRGKRLGAWAIALVTVSADSTANVVVTETDLPPGDRLAKH